MLNSNVPKGQHSPSFSCMNSNEDQFKTDTINLAQKQNALSQLLSSFSRHRHLQDQSLIRKEVLQQHKVFRVLQAWKRVTQQANIKQYEAEVKRDHIDYSLKKKAFRGWREQVDNKHKADAFRLNQLWKHFKLTCLTQLSLRVRRVELSHLLTKHRVSQISQISVQYKAQQKLKTQMAQQHYRQILLRKATKAWLECLPALKAENLEYTKYKLAFTFHRHHRLKLCFSVLTHPNHLTV